MTYKAVVGKIRVAPHPNADRLQIAHIHGFRVVVSIDAKDEDLYVFFQDDGQLSFEFCKEHDLIARKDENGNRAGGFFDIKRRVRAQNFRGVKSEGFAVPVSWFEFTGYDVSQLTPGMEFDQLNNVPICNKYYTEATRKAINGKKVEVNPLKAAFPQHYDTSQFRFAYLEKGDLIIITEKEHGTSVRYGNVEVERPVKSNWLNQFFIKLGWKKQKYYTSKEYVLGTRRAILSKVNNSEYEFGGGYYGGGEPYTIAPRKLYNRLKTDEIIYGEVVGYCSNSAPLFTHSLDKLPDLEKQYGSPVTYSYGCIPGEARLRVYRITQNGRDLSYFELQNRCEELGVEMVSHIDMFIYDGDRDRLNAYIETLLEGPSLIDETHLREGVCIRVENKYGHRVYKEKSFSFKLAEGIVKDNDTYVDLEEVA